MFGDEMSVTSVDLLEELRAALDGIEPLIAGRIVDIEMARLRVLADPVPFRQEFASLVESAGGRGRTAHPIGVRVSRTGSSARIDVGNEGDGTKLDEVIGSMTVPIAPGGVERGRRLNTSAWITPAAVRLTGRVRPTRAPARRPRLEPRRAAPGAGDGGRWTPPACCTSACSPPTSPRR